MFGHVLDPRTGEPARGALLAAVVSESATETDAFSTALLVLGTGGHQVIFGLRPNQKTFLLREERGLWQSESRGFGAGEGQ